MSSSARRGQVDPIPALVAVSVLVAAIGVYATVFRSVPLDRDRPVAERVLSVTVAAATEAGVLDPQALAVDPPRGYAVAVVVRASDRTWRRGPSPPEGAETATAPVLVRTERGESVGRVRVWAWR
ncbi:MAG: hypothetical protein ABEJ77_03600 [Halanaeroarchaeum sp.]